MSQSNYPNDSGDLEPDRSQPRYQPLNPTGSSAEPARPADWPPASQSPTPSYGMPPTAQGSWGTYQPGGPVYGNGNRPYGYNQPSYNQPNSWGGYYSNNANPDPNYNGYYTNDYSNNYGYRMPVQPPQYDPRQMAERRVNARLAFYRHLTTYLIINGFLWFIALATLPVHGHFWPIYISLFWGIGLFFEYRRVFGQSDQQRRQMIEDEMRRMKH